MQPYFISRFILRNFSCSIIENWLKKFRKIISAFDCKNKVNFAWEILCGKVVDEFICTFVTVVVVIEQAAVESL